MGCLGAAEVVLDFADDVLCDTDDVALGSGRNSADVSGEAGLGDEGDDKFAWVGFDLALHAGGYDCGENINDGGELWAFDDGSSICFDVGFDFWKVIFDLGDVRGRGAKLRCKCWIV